MPARSLYDELATIPDPRGLQGLIHPLPAVLGLVTLALLMGRQSLQGMVVKDNQPGLVADIEAGLGFEDTARGLAAPTSP